MPGVKRLGKVDVKWGQIVFFEVQPGRSYHAVEEVIVGDGRQRLGVSGWYVYPRRSCCRSSTAEDVCECRDAAACRVCSLDVVMYQRQPFQIHLGLRMN